ncbi:AAA family ATPase [Syntrophomonas curvata]
MLQWTATKTNVVLAVEPGIDDIILDNLRHMEPFSDDSRWHFSSISHSDLLNTIVNPDILVISRFLPGDKPHEILRYVHEHYQNQKTHVVLLVGAKNEQCRHYMRLAKEMGFMNIVTGDLPGDLPYTLDQALQYSLPEVEASQNKHNTVSEAPVKQRNRGIIIASAGAKGGIGKTSVAAGIVQALALRGIPITAADADYSRQDLTAFFKVDSRGFINNRDTKSSVVPIDRNVYVLPGSGCKTPMNWPDPEEVKATLDALRDTASYVIVDTPSDLNCPHTPVILQESDLILVIIDQSRFTDQDIFDYGSFLLGLGINPHKVKLVVNRYSRRLMPVQEIVRAFNQGIRGDVQIVALIPNQWEKYARASHKGQIPGINKAPWQAIVKEVCAGNVSAQIPTRKAGITRIFKTIKGGM